MFDDDVCLKAIKEEERIKREREREKSANGA
jgi:hypothetical protein